MLLGWHRYTTISDLCVKWIIFINKWIPSPHYPQAWTRRRISPSVTPIFLTQCNMSVYPLPLCSILRLIRTSIHFDTWNVFQVFTPHTLAMGRFLDHSMLRF